MLAADGAAATDELGTAMKPGLVANGSFGSVVGSVAGEKHDPELADPFHIRPRAENAAGGSGWATTGRTTAGCSAASRPGSAWRDRARATPGIFLGPASVASCGFAMHP